MNDFNLQRIVMLGLDNAGKTSILYTLKLGKDAQMAPTIGYNVETVIYKNIEFNVWVRAKLQKINQYIQDVGGQEKIRSLWQHYYSMAHGLIFVIDCADQNRIEEARIALNNVLKNQELKGVSLLVFANKSDLTNVCNTRQLLLTCNLEIIARRIGKAIRIETHVWQEKLQIASMFGKECRRLSGRL